MILHAIKIFPKDTKFYENDYICWIIIRTPVLSNNSKLVDIIGFSNFIKNNIKGVSYE